MFSIITEQDHTIYCYLSTIIICPPTCVFSLLYLFGFCSLFLWPGRGQCCECWVGSFTGVFFLFTSFHAVARERERERGVRGHLFNWPILSPMLWQSKCYLQPHCTGRTLPHTFHDESGKSKMEIWPSAGIGYSNERCSVSSNLTLTLCLTVRWKFYTDTGVLLLLLNAHIGE